MPESGLFAGTIHPVWPGPRGHRHVVPVCGKFLAHPGRPFSWAAGQLLIVIDSYEDDNPREEMPGSL